MKPHPGVRIAAGTVIQRHPRQGSPTVPSAKDDAETGAPGAVQLLVCSQVQPIACPQWPACFRDVMVAPRHPGRLYVVGPRQHGGVSVTHNVFGGEAFGVVQTEHVEGGVHFYGPSRPPKSPPAQVLPPPIVYTNNERQLREITDALSSAPEGGDEHPRMVVIQGPVGGGKSATACQWLHDHRDDFPDGLFHAPLGLFRRRRDGSQPPSGESDASGAESECLLQFLLEIGYAPGEIPQTLPGRANFFRSWSAGKRVALVVDDPLTGGQVRTLQPGLGRSVVLVTSAVPLLGVHLDKPTFVELDPLSRASATLLVRRILAEGDTRLDQEPAETDQLVELCRHHTVALCVAAELLARRPNRPVSWLTQRLAREERRLRTLSPDSSLSLAAVLNTAVERLDNAARRAYAAFGQHPGSGDVSVEAFAAALDEDHDDMQDQLDRLVEARLAQRSAPDRYFVGNLVRDHAREHVTDRTWEARFVSFYAERATGLGNAVMPQRGWLERLWPDRSLSVMAVEAEVWLERERANLRATAELLAEQDHVLLLPLAVGLWPFHERAKHLDDMDRINELAANLAQRQGYPFAAGLCQVQRGFAFRHRAENDKAAELFAVAARTAAEHGPPDLAATAIESLGLARREQGDVSAAQDLLRQNLTAAHDLENPRRTALAQMHLGSVESAREAGALLDEAIETFRGLPIPDVHNEHKSLLWRGIRNIEPDNLDQARQDVTAALRHMSAEGRSFDMAHAYAALGHVAAAEGSRGDARQHLQRAESTYRAWGFLDQAERVRADREVLGE